MLVPGSKRFSRSISLAVYCLYTFFFGLIMSLADPTLAAFIVCGPLQLVTRSFFARFLRLVLRAGILGSVRPGSNLSRCSEPSSPAVRQFGSGFHSNRPSTYHLSRVHNSLRGPDHAASTLCTPCHSSSVVA